MIRLAIFRNSTSDIVLGVVMLLALPVAGYAQFNEAASKSNRENQHAETTTSISSSLPNKHTFDEVRRSLAQQLVSTQQGKGIKQLAVTKIYYNGSSIQHGSARC